MATSRVRRGRESEELGAEAFRQDGWPYAERNPASLPGRDIKGVPGVAVEVKARNGLDLKAWMKQAKKNAGGDLAVLLIRLNGSGQETIDDWPTVISFKDLRNLLKEAGFQ